jgi:metallo-beta-lactamase family protein
MKVSFHGADRSVTGSCHLVECAGKQILIDCGLHQGSRDLEADNAGPFGFAAERIDYLLLTHAHLDHCGRLPLLAKRGFRGEIITTAPSRELARLVMLDAAHLQEDDARGSSGGQPLYSTLDALNCLEYFGRTATYDQPLEVTAGVRATFIDAGHILGSASILLSLEEAGHRVEILFSGDLGTASRGLLRSPAPPPPAEIVVMETTYGDRLHKPLAPSIDEFFGAITDTFERGGNVVVPTFALERAQDLIYFLSQGEAQGRLSRSMQVYLDSPMAIAALEVFRRHPESLARGPASLIEAGQDVFALSGLHCTRERAESAAINAIRSGAVIMAGSGMATGGRVRHHLRHNLGRPQSSVVFVGYAAEGTLARQIIDGAKQVEIFGQSIPVRAKIYTINGFSGHADQAELLAWQARTGAKRTFLVHGDEAVMQQFAGRLKATQVEMPAPHQAYDLLS